MGLAEPGAAGTASAGGARRRAHLPEVRLSAWISLAVYIEWLRNGYLQLYGATVRIPPWRKVHLTRGTWKATVAQQ